MCNLITLLQDARLIEGVAQHRSQGWARVTEFMGNGLSLQQCYNRWRHLEPRQRGLRIGNWQPDEVPHPYYCYYCSNLYWYCTAQSLLTCLLTCFYMTGGAFAGAGAATCDTIALVHSEEGHDEGAHKLDGYRQGAGPGTT